MPSANERLMDIEIDHAVDLQQYSFYVVRRMISLLNRTDADLFAQLQIALDSSATAYSVERLDLLLNSVRRLNAQAYQAARTVLEQELRDLSAEEADFRLAQATAATPAAVGVTWTAVVPEQIHAAAMATPFRGRLLREWFASLEEARAARLRDQVRLGFAEGQTIPQIMQRIRGTRANKFADGAIQTDRREAEAVARTAISHVAGFARDAFLQANEAVVKAVVWVATLDSRTTELCRIRDGKAYANTASHRPLGHSVPWLGGPGRLHWRCRSTSAPVLKSFRELGLDADDLPPSVRESMDGEVPAETTYAQWIKRQSAARQDAIIGPFRAKLMREGRLPFDQLYTDRGVPLSVNELRERHPGAVRRAGL